MKKGAWLHAQRPYSSDLLSASPSPVPSLIKRFDERTPSLIQRKTHRRDQSPNSARVSSTPSLNITRGSSALILRSNYLIVFLQFIIQLIEYKLMRLSPTISDEPCSSRERVYPNHGQLTGKSRRIAVINTINGDC